MINLICMVFILFVLCDEINKARSHLHMFWIFLNKKSFKSNFHFSAIQKSFSVFIELFSTLTPSIHSDIFLSHFILSTIFFLLAQSLVLPNRAFDTPTQFSLVIFNLQTPAVTFGLPGHRAALRCVIRLRHCGAASPPLPLPIRKWLHPIVSPFLFSSHITGVIEVSPSLPPFP
jgi:hypothetical protein